MGTARRVRNPVAAAARTPASCSTSAARAMSCERPRARTSTMKGTPAAARHRSPSLSSSSVPAGPDSAVTAAADRASAIACRRMVAPPRRSRAGKAFAARESRTTVGASGLPRATRAIPRGSSAAIDMTIVTAVALSSPARIAFAPTRRASTRWSAPGAKSTASPSGCVEAPKAPRVRAAG